MRSTDSEMFAHSRQLPSIDNAISEQAERHDQQNDRGPRRNDTACRSEDLLLGVCEHAAPISRWRLRAEAEERERGKVEQRVSEIDSELADDQLAETRPDVATADPRHPEPLNPARVDV